MRLSFRLMSDVFN